MKSRFLLSVLLSVSLPLAAFSQSNERVNNSLHFSVASNVRLSQPVGSLYCFDGELRLSSGGMLLHAAYADGVTSDLEIDTLLLSVDKEMDYVVRHPVSRSLFFTKKDSKGNASLYEYYEKKPGRYDVRRIRPSRFSYSIEHPVFSPDGNVMVFVSNCPLGFGGSDLWYSEKRNNEWQYPQNMGHRINTSGDESMPTMYGDFLIFSTNGRKAGRTDYDLYAARLIAQEQTGDTVMMLPVGQCDAYSLESPFCGSSDDLFFTVNDKGNGGWWVSRDTAGHETVYSFQGRLDCIMMLGVVTDNNGRPIEHASVTVRQNKVSDRVVYTDRYGNYTLFLQPEQSYELFFSAPDHFAVAHSVVPRRLSEELLYCRLFHDASLFAFTLDSVYAYNDCFNGIAGSELSSAGRSRMDVLARYMQENEHLKLWLRCDYRSVDATAYCQLLNEARLQSVRDYLTQRGVRSDRVLLYGKTEVDNGVWSDMTVEGLDDAEISRRLFLVLSH